MICTNRTDPTSEVQAWAGAPCPDCGHTMLVHGGPANPALELCVTCEQLDAVAELRAARDTLANRMDQLAAWKTKAVDAITRTSERCAALELRVTDLEAKP